MPSHSNLVDDRASNALHYATTGACNVTFGDDQRGSPARRKSSVLTFGFNKLWCDALNLRKKINVHYFAMLHADVEPEPWWLDKLVAEQQRLNCDVLSCVIPFKISAGLTSTGLGDPHAPRGEAGITGDTRRLTLREAHSLPESFRAADTDCPTSVLLVNTGCWIARLGPWVDAKDERGRRRFYFANHDQITEDTEGHVHAETRSEDWNMSYQLHDLGCSVYATRKVKVIHHGDFGFANWPAWGEWDVDANWKAVMELRARKDAENSAPALAPHAAG